MPKTTPAEYIPTAFIPTVFDVPESTANFINDVLEDDASLVPLLGHKIVPVYRRTPAPVGSGPLLHYQLTVEIGRIPGLELTKESVTQQAKALMEIRSPVATAVPKTAEAAPKLSKTVPAPAPEVIPEVAAPTVPPAPVVSKAPKSPAKPRAKKAPAVQPEPVVSTQQPPATPPPVTSTPDSSYDHRLESPVPAIYCLFMSIEQLAQRDRTKGWEGRLKTVEHARLQYSRLLHPGK